MQARELLVEGVFDHTAASPQTFAVQKAASGQAVEFVELEILRNQVRQRQ